MLSSIEICEKLFEDGKIQSSLDMAMEILYSQPKNIRAMMVLFNSSLAMGDDFFAGKVLSMLQSSGCQNIAKESELLNLLINTRQDMLKHYNFKNFNESLKAAKIADEIAPKSQEFKIHKAKCFIRLEMPILAKAIVDIELVKDPENVSLLFLDGVVKCYLGQLEAGVKIIDKAIKYSQSDIQKKKFLEQKQKFEKPLESVKRAKKLEEAGKHDEAVFIYTRELQASKNYPSWIFELLIMRAKVHRKNKMHNLAIKDINEALAILDVFPNNSHRLLCAECFYDSGDYTSCILDCETILECSKDPVVHKLMENATEKKTLQEIINKIDHGMIEQAYDISYQHLKKSTNEKFIIYAIACARELKDDSKIESLGKLIKDDPEMVDIINSTIGTFNENIATTPDEFIRASTFYNEGNLEKCIELLEAAKEKGFSMEDFPEFTLQKAKKNAATHQQG